MFEPRGRMIRSGMYQPVIEKIAHLIKPGNLLDVGCGEGSFLQEINQVKANPVNIGFDIAKEGVYLASNQAIHAFWCVADLTNLPFADHSFDTILNIFSPSHYSEFKRVMKNFVQFIIRMGKSIPMKRLFNVSQKNLKLITVNV